MAYNAEFWRFAFTIIVALYHLEIFYQRKLMPLGTAAVEFFFIIAGFTIAMSAARRMEMGGVRELSARESRAIAVSYLKKKLVAIYPMLAVTLVLTIVIIPLAFPQTQMFQGPPMMQGPSASGFMTRLLGRIGALINSEWEWLFLVGSPVGYNDTLAVSAPLVPLWFLTHLLLVGYLYTFLVNRKYDLMMFLAPLIAVFGFIYFTLNSELILDFYVKMGLFNAGAVRALYQMALGLTAYQIYVFMKNRDWTLPGRILLQLLEVFAIYRYFSLTFRVPEVIDSFRRIPYIFIIILLSFVNVTLLSNLLNRKFMEKLGKISLPIYLLHFPIATVYWNVLFWSKMNRGMQSLPEIFQNSGGMTAWPMLRQIPISIGDVLMYVPIVIIASVILHLSIAGIRALRRKRKREEVEAL